MLVTGPSTSRTRRFGGDVDDTQAIRLGETNRSIVVILRGSEPLGEFSHAEILPVTWTARIVDLLHEITKSRFVSEWEGDGETQVMLERPEDVRPAKPVRLRRLDQHE